MDGVRLLPPLEAMRAIQAINAVVHNILFGLGFFGTPILCKLVLLALFLPGGSGAGRLVAALGAVVYIALAFVVTFARNIPLNEAPAAATGAEQWNAFPALGASGTTCGPWACCSRPASWRWEALDQRG
jgi:uncharacterized membrane protein